MANREKGEVSLKVGDQTYTLVLDLNAMCEMEDHWSTPEKQAFFPEIAARCARGSMRDIRAVIWAAMRRHHPEITIEGAGRIIGALSDIPELNRQMSTLLSTTQADPEDVAELSKGAEKRPLKAQPKNAVAMTGDRSISRAAASG